MRSKPVAFLLADLGVLKTHSRPYTSTDNPYSEAQFKTLKYRPEFPDRFRLDRARPRVLPAVLRLVQPPPSPLRDRPDDPRGGPPRPGARQLHAARQRVLDAAYAATPERFVRRPPTPPELPTAAWINKPDTRRPLTKFDDQVSHPT